MGVNSLWVATHRAAETVAGATVTAPMVLPIAGAVEPAGFVVHGAAGVIAGTVWRMRYWFREKTGFHVRTAVDDSAAVLALLIGTYGACDHFILTGWSAALTGLGVAVVGIEPFRKGAILCIDTFARNWKGGNQSPLATPEFSQDEEIPHDLDGDKRHDS